MSHRLEKHFAAGNYRQQEAQPGGILSTLSGREKISI